ncbi:MAG TPA: response regulator [Polyangiaceae bacterium]|nr:response regulator [Polyangiaceae bacterium]
MKSCRCAQCNVSSARYAWGFALLARDGWAVSEGSEFVGTADGAWLCPACTRRTRLLSPGLAKPATPAAPPKRRARSRGFLRILLVDDEDMLRRSVARTLADFEIVSVSSGAEALAIFAEDTDFDAILSDVMMPNMSGPELFARCYHDYPQLAQRFVFTSGNPESARTELSRVIEELGAPRPILLAKPSPRESLLLALFAAAAHGEPASGTFSVGGEGDPVEVTNYRG